MYVLDNAETSLIPIQSNKILTEQRILFKSALEKKFERQYFLTSKGNILVCIPQKLRNMILNL